MEYVKGDLVELAKQGKFDVIIHGCNCYCNWDAGIAKQMKKEFPGAYAKDIHTCKGDFKKLGSFTSYNQTIETYDNGVFNVTIINAYTQYGYGRGIIRADYDAIRACFKKIRKGFCPEYKFGIPKIGAGLAGGDWNAIASIIEEEMEGRNVTVVQYEVK